MQLIQNELVAQEIELFKLRIFRSGRRQIISLAIDRREGGITLEECAKWNRHFADLFEKARLFGDSYVVEVASPGADWPLQTERDFRRVTRRKLRVRYRAPDAALREEIGTLQKVEDGRLTLDLKDPAEPLPIPLGAIVQADVPALL